MRLAIIDDEGYVYDVLDDIQDHDLTGYSELESLLDQIAFAITNIAGSNMRKVGRV